MHVILLVVHTLLKSHQNALQCKQKSAELTSRGSFKAMRSQIQEQLSVQQSLPFAFITGSRDVIEDHLPSEHLANFRQRCFRPITGRVNTAAGR